MRSTGSILFDSGENAYIDSQSVVNILSEFISKGGLNCPIGSTDNQLLRKEIDKFQKERGRTIQESHRLHYDIECLSTEIVNLENLILESDKIIEQLRLENSRLKEKVVSINGVNKPT